MNGIFCLYTIFLQQFTTCRHRRRKILNIRRRKGGEGEHGSEHWVGGQAGANFLLIVN